MKPLEKRLAKLEQGANGKRRVICIRARGDHTDQDIALVLASHGIVKTPHDTVAILRILSEANSGEPPALLHVLPMR